MTISVAPRSLATSGGSFLSVCGLSTEDVHNGSSKWHGITGVGTKLYAAPFFASTIFLNRTGARHRRRLLSLQDNVVRL